MAFSTDSRGHVLGVDGGGSRTKCVIASLSGTVLGWGTSGPSNPLTVGVSPAADAIAEAVREASDSAGVDRFEFACLAVAGVERPRARESLLSEVAARVAAGRLLVVSDAAAALAGATGCGAGAVVVAGTGSIAYGVNPERETARAGGWGWRVGDEGSGYDIGRRSISASLRAYDGRGEPTKLVGKLEKFFGLSTLSEIIDVLYGKDIKPYDVAALAPIVAEAAVEGDEVAAKILREAGDELGKAAVAVIRRLRLRGDFTVAMTGGVFKLGLPIRTSFERTVRLEASECSIIPSRFEPAVGAALLALQELGVNIDEGLLKRVETSLQTLDR